MWNNIIVGKCNAWTKKLIQSIVRDLKTLVFNGKSHITVPLAHKLVGKMDVPYLVSFPRSGNTWVRTIVCNITNPEARGNPEIFNEVIPEVRLREVYKIRRKNNLKLIKSHMVFAKDVQKAVYVVRDGRDAVISYYHYTTTRKGSNVGFSEWFDRYRRGLFGPTWHAHVESWLSQGEKRLGSGMLVVRFEDLKKDTIGTAGRIVEFLGIDTTHDQLRSAVDMASLEQARTWEKNEKGKLLDSDASFYRGGKSGQWSSYFNSELRSEFWQSSATAMELAGYADFGN